MADTPYNTNPELVAMKNDIANRKFRVQLIGMGVTAVLAIGALAAFFLIPGAGAAVGAMGGASATKAVLGLGMAAAGTVTSLVTMKEMKKLEMDEQFLQSYMQGKNYWGEGYREEVAEHGYALKAPAFPGAPPPSLAGKNMIQRSS